MKQDQHPVSSNDRPAVEWFVGGLSAAAVVALIAFLAYQALFNNRASPDVSVTIERVDHLDGRTFVAFTIQNRGDEAVAAVTLSARSEASSGRSPTKQVEFDYLAAHAVRRGAFVFANTINPDDIKIDIGGYTEP